MWINNEIADLQRVIRFENILAGMDYHYFREFEDKIDRLRELHERHRPYDKIHIK